MQKFSKRLKIVSEILLLLPVTSFCTYPRLDSLRNNSPTNNPSAPPQSQIEGSSQPPRYYDIYNEDRRS